MSVGALELEHLSGGQRVAVKYFAAAMVLFLAQILFGLIGGLQVVYPNLFYGVLDFSVNRTLHVNAMIVWLLFGFIGCVYWLIEDEAGTDLVGRKLANINFWVLTSAVVVVVLVYLLVQVGAGRWPASGSSTKVASTSKRRAGQTSASSFAF
jgi:nitric oxide reductase subunit B